MRSNAADKARTKYLREQQIRKNESDWNDYNDHYNVLSSFCGNDYEN